MRTGVEIDMVVRDSLAALALYDKIFGIERLEATAVDRGLNEAVFTLLGTRFHLLDENPAYGLHAPKPEEGRPMWVNVAVPDVRAVFDRAVAEGCTVIQAVSGISEIGVTNAVFSDPFGYVWMLHQVYRTASLGDRLQYMTEQPHSGGAATDQIKQ